VNWHNGCALAL